MARIKGNKVMVFVDAVAIALATNHTLTISPSILEDRTKDDGDAPVGEFDTYTWSMSSESLFGTSESNNEMHAMQLVDKMLGLEKVQVAFDAALPTTGSVPKDGWTNAGGEGGYEPRVGDAYIESLSISAGSTGFATVSATFKGQGELS